MEIPRKYLKYISIINRSIKRENIFYSFTIYIYTIYIYIYIYIYMTLYINISLYNIGQYILPKISYANNEIPAYKFHSAIVLYFMYNCLYCTTIVVYIVVY